MMMPGSVYVHDENKPYLTNPRLLDIYEAAWYLRSSVKCLSRMLQEGQGPAFIKLDDGMVRYRKSDLDRWRNIRKWYEKEKKEARSA